MPKIKDITPNNVLLIPARDRFILPDMEMAQVRGGWATGATEQKKGSNILDQNLRVVRPGGDIQKAIDELDLLDGGIVHLVAGTHRPGANITLYSNIIFEGEGIGNTIIDFDANANNISFLGTVRTSAGNATATEGSATVSGSSTSFTSASAGDFFVILPLTGSTNFISEILSIESDTSLTLVDAWPMATRTNGTFQIINMNSNSAIKNFTIKDSGHATASLDIRRARNFRAENIYVYNNSTSDGITIAQLFDSEFRNCESSYNGDEGWYVSGLRKVSFYDCSAIGNAGNGFQIDNVIANTVQGTLYSCVADGNTGDGYNIIGSNLNFFNCHAKDNDADGFDFGGDESTLVGCVAINNASNGIEVGSTADNNSIINCITSGNDSGIGINIVASANNTRIIDIVTSETTAISDGGTDTFYENIGAGTFTASNGANNNIDIDEIRFVRISGPTAAFSISGVTAGINGKEVYLYNSTGQDMTITNDATSTAANRILTLTGADVVLTGTSVARIIYNLTDARWILVGTQG